MFRFITINISTTSCTAKAPFSANRGPTVLELRSCRRRILCNTAPCYTISPINPVKNDIDPDSESETQILHAKNPSCLTRTWWGTTVTYRTQILPFDNVAKFAKKPTHCWRIGEFSSCANRSYTAYSGFDSFNKKYVEQLLIVCYLITEKVITLQIEQYIRKKAVHDTPLINGR